MFYGPYVIIPITICVLYSPWISRDSLYAYSVNFVMITVNANNCKSLIIHTLCRASDFFSSFSSESESSFYIASTKPRGGRPHHLPTTLQTKVLSTLSSNFNRARTNLLKQIREAPGLWMSSLWLSWLWVLPCNYNIPFKRDFSVNFYHKAEPLRSNFQTLSFNHRSLGTAKLTVNKELFILKWSVFLIRTCSVRFTLRALCSVVWEKRQTWY